jgi:hypothetical protein
VVEKANHVVGQRFWRTMADDASVETAQRLLDKWCSTRGDLRMRATVDGKMTVATVAAVEPLRGVPPAPFPATLTGGGRRGRGTVPPVGPSGVTGSSVADGGGPVSGVRRPVSDGGTGSSPVASVRPVGR